MAEIEAEILVSFDRVRGRDLEFFGLAVGCMD